MEEIDELQFRYFKMIIFVFTSLSKNDDYNA